MSKLRKRLSLPVCLMLMSGCAAPTGLESLAQYDRPEAPLAADYALAAKSAQVAELTAQPSFPRSAMPPAGLSGPQVAQSQVPGIPRPPVTGANRWPEATRQSTEVRAASHLRKPVPPANPDPVSLTIDGRTYRLVPENPQQDSLPAMLKGSRPRIFPVSQPEQLPTPPGVETTGGSAGATEIPPDAVPLDLVSALSMVGGQHPAVGIAQWRVQEAYAQYDQAKVLWLPSIQAGFSFNRHDGNLQNSDGDIIDVNRNSFQYGLGAAAVGAGTTQRPGVVARFHAADAIFQPGISQKAAWARGHAANATMNEQLMRVATAYLDLLAAEQDSRIIEESRGRTDELAQITKDFAETGQGLQADADRMATESILIEGRQVAAQERIQTTSAILTETLSAPAGRRIMPLDPTVVPIDLVPPEVDQVELLNTGLRNRPELKEAQALVAVAFDQFKRQKFAPFVPSVLLGFSQSGFGGGIGNNLGNIDDRIDFDAWVTWEVRNFGLGERASRRETSARIQQAKYEKVRTLDRVAREIVEAHEQVQHRQQRIRITQQAIQAAEDSYHRNLRRIREGQGLPIEVLQSVQALETAQRAYLNAVIDYNQAQFRLQWAIGWPVDATHAGA